MLRYILDYEEYFSNSNNMIVKTSKNIVCVRVYPKWNNTDGDSSATECVHIPKDRGMIH